MGRKDRYYYSVQLYHCSIAPSKLKTLTRKRALGPCIHLNKKNIILRFYDRKTRFRIQLTASTLPLPDYLAANVELAGKQSTPILPWIPSHIITGGLPAGLVSSMSSNWILEHTALGEQTSFATFRPLAPLLLPVKFWNKIFVISTREG
jgi:hypothetical protein